MAVNARQINSATNNEGANNFPVARVRDTDLSEYALIGLANMIPAFDENADPILDDDGNQLFEFQNIVGPQHPLNVSDTAVVDALIATQVFLDTLSATIDNQNAYINQYAEKNIRLYYTDNFADLTDDLPHIFLPGYINEAGVTAPIDLYSYSISNNDTTDATVDIYLDEVRRATVSVKAGDTKTSIVRLKGLASTEDPQVAVNWVAKLRVAPATGDVTITGYGRIFTDDAL